MMAMIMTHMLIILLMQHLYGLLLVEMAQGNLRINDSAMVCSQKMNQLNTEIQLLRTFRHKNTFKLFASWIDEDKGIVNIIIRVLHIMQLETGKKPAALYKVKDVDVRSFIETCLAPVDERLSASELLKSSFLSTK